MSNYSESFNAAFGDLFSYVTKALDEIAAEQQAKLRADQDIEKVRAELAVLRAENASLQKLHAADQDKINDLTDENTRLQAARKADYDTITDLAAQNQRLESTVKNLRSRLLSTEGRRNQLYKQLTAAQNQRDSYKTAIEKMKCPTVTVVTDQAELTSLQNRVRDLTTELIEANRKTDAAIAAGDRYYKQLAAVQDQCDSYQKAIENAEQENAALNTRIDQLQTSINELRSQNRMLAFASRNAADYLVVNGARLTVKEVQNLIDGYDKKIDEINTLRQLNDKQAAEIRALKERNRALCDESDATSKSAAYISHNLDVIAAQLDSIRRSVGINS